MKKILKVSILPHVKGALLTSPHLVNYNGSGKIELSSGNYIDPTFLVASNESRVIYRQDFRTF